MFQGLRTMTLQYPEKSSKKNEIYSKKQVILTIKSVPNGLNTKFHCTGKSIKQ